MRLRIPLILALLAGACTKPLPDPPPPSATQEEPTGSLRIGIASPRALDPKNLDTADALLVGAQIFDGLVAYEPGTLAPIPALAESWQVLDGGRRFVFDLRPEARFHDGEQVRAGDFVYAWNRIADPAEGSPYSFLLAAVKGYTALRGGTGVQSLAGVEAVNDRTLSVTLNGPRPGFVSVLGHPALSPLRKARAGTVATFPVGTGPFQLSQEWLTGSIRLVKFPDYYGVAPQVDEVEFEAYERAVEGWPDFQSGDLDVAEFPTELFGQVRADYGDAGVVTLARSLFCGFNLRSSKLRDDRLREAVSIALNRPALAARLYGSGAIPAGGLVSPGIPGYRKGACGELCAHSPVRAAQLVGALPEAAKTFSLDLSDSPIARRLGEAMTEQLSRAGLDPHVRTHPEEGFAQLLREGRQEVFCLVWQADWPGQDAVLEPLLASESSENRTAFDSEAVDAALAEATRSDSPAKRQASYRRAERMALEQLPLFPVVWFRSQLAVKPYVSGFRIDPMGRFEAASLSLES